MPFRKLLVSLTAALLIGIAATASARADTIPSSPTPRPPATATVPARSTRRPSLTLRLTTPRRTTPASPHRLRPAPTGNARQATTSSPQRRLPAAASPSLATATGQRPAFQRRVPRLRVHHRLDFACGNPNDGCRRATRATGDFHRLGRCLRRFPRRSLQRHLVRFHRVGPTSEQDGGIGRADLSRDDAASGHGVAASPQGAQERHAAPSELA